MYQLTLWDVWWWEQIINPRNNFVTDLPLTWIFRDLCYAIQKLLYKNLQILEHIKNKPKYWISFSMKLLLIVPPIPAGT